jgi:hypothetical protein
MLNPKLSISILPFPQHYHSPTFIMASLYQANALPSDQPGYSFSTAPTTVNEPRQHRFYP